MAQESGVIEIIPSKTQDSTPSPGTKDSLVSHKEAEQDLTVVKQIKHLGLQKQSGIGLSKRPAEELVVVENKMEAMEQKRILRKDQNGLTFLQGGNKRLGWQKQNSLGMSTKPVDAERLVDVNKLASLEATLVQNYEPPIDRVAGVECRATSVAKNRVDARKQDRKDQEGLTVLQGAGRLSSSDLALQNQPKLAGLVAQEKKLTNQTNSRLVVNPGKSKNDPPGMKIVVTVADYQNSKTGSKEFADLNNPKKIDQARCLSVNKSKEVEDRWLENGLLPKGWKMKFKTWKSMKKDKIHRGLVFKTGYSTILRGVKCEMCDDK